LAALEQDGVECPWETLGSLDLNQTSHDPSYHIMYTSYIIRNILTWNRLLLGLAPRHVLLWQYLRQAIGRKLKICKLILS
jgi:hypothetical protein